ncbi:MAG: energy-coupling factor transporter ATPase [Clostridia bacterium]|nr:energy-coupling factor transporter ATPase [Clostridia bacterium]
MSINSNIKDLENKNEASIKVDDVSFYYGLDSIEDENEKKNLEPAVKNVSLEIKKGEYIAILGHNGSGKSTLAKLISALELPNEGKIFVDGFETSDEASFEEIRKKTAIVFQNPDNQIVGATVEEDVAFGPENLGVPNPELRNRVDDCLKKVGLYEYRERESSKLSGGQKQKLAIAGALAMKPEILILDEATSMLDPISRDEFLSLVEKLTKENNMTLITVTHDMNEAMRVDRAIVMEHGKIVMSGLPQEIFSSEEEINRIGLELPQHIKLANEIARRTNINPVTEDYRSVEATVDYIRKAVSENPAKSSEAEENSESSEKKEEPKVIMSVKDLTHTYDNRKKPVLDGISFNVREGRLIALIGKSGCGKTTLISHMNAVMKATSGYVEVITKDGKVLNSSNKKDIREIRNNVGLVFQYPEYQLFEETVYKDVEYGLKKQGVPEEDRKKIIEDTIELVGLDKKLLERSPFDLSGGQKRRVAIAGVLVMKPRILVLDEPAAGLDPKSKKEMFKIITNLKKSGVTIILVSHNMDDVMRYTDRVLILSDGKTLKSQETKSSFKDRKALESLGIKRPVLHELVETILNNSDDEELSGKIAAIKDYSDAVELIIEEGVKA